MYCARCLKFGRVSVFPFGPVTPTFVPVTPKCGRCARDAHHPSMALGWCILAQTEDASLRRLTQAFEIKMVNTQVYTDAAARNAEAIRLFWSL